MRKIGLSAVVWAGLAAISTTSVGALAGLLIAFMLVMIIVPVAFVTRLQPSHIAIAMAGLYLVSVVVLIVLGAIAHRRRRETAHVLWFCSVNLIGFAAVAWISNLTLQDKWPS
ncbi:MAG: hypothetical protein H7236_04325 [Gemmatimonadaceae bacterium]|nr:hypothetical protein [Caulobacter sp.]